jgi:hypothetical protein
MERLIASPQLRSFDDDSLEELFICCSFAGARVVVRIEKFWTRLSARLDEARAIEIVPASSDSCPGRHECFGWHTCSRAQIVKVAARGAVRSCLRVMNPLGFENVDADISEKPVHRKR